MKWQVAAVRGAIIFLYFVVATVWLPHRVLLLGFVESGSSFVRDLIVLVVWGVALGGGMYALRVGQRKGLI
jgi:hypothetical protein